MSLNKVMLIGNVGRDPEVRYLDGNSGQAKVATFTLATTERYRDRNGETRENTEWHNIVAWRNTADVVERFVKKGTQGNALASTPPVRILPLCGCRVL